jgi:hypothetical protein
MKWRPRCKTCKFWDQRYPENNQLGACKHMGVILWADNQVASLNVVPAVEAGMSEPTSDIPVVNTLAYFGCAEHSDYRV